MKENALNLSSFISHFSESFDSQKNLSKEKVNKKFYKYQHKDIKLIIKDIRALITNRGDESILKSYSDKNRKNKIIDVSLKENVKSGLTDLKGVFKYSCNLNLICVAWFPDEDPLEILALNQGVEYNPIYGSRCTRIVNSRPNTEFGNINTDDADVDEELYIPNAYVLRPEEKISTFKEILFISIIQINETFKHSLKILHNPYRSSIRSYLPKNVIGLNNVIYMPNPPLTILGTCILPVVECEFKFDMDQCIGEKEKKKFNFLKKNDQTLYFDFNGFERQFNLKIFDHQALKSIEETYRKDFDHADLRGILDFIFKRREKLINVGTLNAFAVSINHNEGLLGTWKYNNESFSLGCKFSNLQLSKLKSSQLSECASKSIETQNLITPIDILLARRKKKLFSSNTSTSTFFKKVEDDGTSLESRKNKILHEHYNKNIALARVAHIFVTEITDLPLIKYSLNDICNAVISVVVIWETEKDCEYILYRKKRTITAKEGVKIHSLSCKNIQSMIQKEENVRLFCSFNNGVNLLLYPGLDPIINIVVSINDKPYAHLKAPINLFDAYQDINSYDDVMTHELYLYDSNINGGYVNLIVQPRPKFGIFLSSKEYSSLDGMRYMDSSSLHHNLNQTAEPNGYTCPVIGPYGKWSTFSADLKENINNRDIYKLKDTGILKEVEKEEKDIIDIDNFNIPFFKPVSFNFSCDQLEECAENILDSFNENDINEKQERETKEEPGIIFSVGQGPVDPQKCIAYGYGLKGGCAGKWLQFKVKEKNKFGETIKNKNKKGSVSEEGGTIKLHMESVGYSYYAFIGDPYFNMDVNCYNKDSNLVSKSCVNQVRADELTCNIQWEVQDTGDGIYTIEYLYNKPGKKLLHVLYDGIPISGSPFEITLTSDDPNNRASYVIGRASKYCFASISPFNVRDEIYVRNNKNVCNSNNNHVNSYIYSKDKKNNNNSLYYKDKIEYNDEIKNENMNYIYKKYVDSNVKPFIKIINDNSSYNDNFYANISIPYYINDFKVVICDILGNRISAGGHSLAVRGKNGAHIVKVTDNMDGTYTIYYIAYIPKKEIQSISMDKLVTIEKMINKFSYSDIILYEEEEKFFNYIKENNICIYTYVEIDIFLYEKRLLGRPLTPLLQNICEIRYFYDVYDKMSIEGMLCDSIISFINQGKYKEALETMKMIVEQDRNKNNTNISIAQSMLNDDEFYEKQINTLLNPLNVENLKNLENNQVTDVKTRWLKLAKLKEKLTEVVKNCDFKENILVQSAFNFLKNLQKAQIENINILSEKHHLNRLEEENLLPLEIILEKQYEETFFRKTIQLTNYVRTLETKKFDNLEELMQIYRHIADELRLLNRFETANVLDKINECLCEEIELKKIKNLLLKKKERLSKVEDVIQKKEKNIKELSNSTEEIYKKNQCPKDIEIYKKGRTYRDKKCQTEDVLSLRQGVMGSLIVARATNLISKDKITQSITQAVKEAWKSCKSYDIHTTLKKLLRMTPRLKQCIKEMFLHYSKVIPTALDNRELVYEGLPIGLTQTAFFRFCQELKLHPAFLNDYDQMNEIFEKFSVETITERIRREGFLRILSYFLWQPMLRELAYINILYVVADTALKNERVPRNDFMSLNISRLHAFHYFCKYYFIPLYNILYKCQDFRIVIQPLLQKCSFENAIKINECNQNKTQKHNNIMKYCRNYLPYDIFIMLTLEPMELLFIFYSELSMYPKLRKCRENDISPNNYFNKMDSKLLKDSIIVPDKKENEEDDDYEQTEDKFLSTNWVSVFVFVEMMKEFGVVPGYLDAFLCLNIAKNLTARSDVLRLQCLSTFYGINEYRKDEDEQKIKKKENTKISIESIMPNTHMKNSSNEEILQFYGRLNFSAFVESIVQCLCECVIRNMPVTDDTSVIVEEARQLLFLFGLNDSSRILLHTRRTIKSSNAKEV